MLNIGRPFRFQPSYAQFPWDEPCCYLEQYAYPFLPRPARRLADDVAVDLNTFLFLFSPTVQLQRRGADSCTLAGPAGRCDCRINRQEITLRAPMAALLGWELTMTDSCAVFAPPGYTAPPPTPLSETGNLSRLFWSAPLERLIPYRLYIPVNWDREPLPMLVVLHGGGSSPDELILLSGGRIQRLAEERGFLLLCADAAVENSSYGCPIPPQGLAADSHLFDDTPEILQGKRLSLQALEAVIRETAAAYGVDRQRLYMAGNSMGGIGTFYFAATHPGLLRAIAPAGAAPDVSRFDATPLRGLPIFFTAGTEDHHGFCHLEAAYQALRAQGLSITFHPIAGGSHAGAWIENLDQWVEELLSC